MFLCIETKKRFFMKNQTELAKVLTKITNVSTMDAFLAEICTKNELKDLALRWKLLKELNRGKPQRQIAKEHKISLCKITRGSKLLRQEDSVVRKILNTYSEG